MDILAVRRKPDSLGILFRVLYRTPDYPGELHAWTLEVGAARDEMDAIRAFRKEWGSSEFDKYRKDRNERVEVACSTFTVEELAEFQTMRGLEV